LLGAVQQIVSTDLVQWRTIKAESALTLLGADPDVMLLAAMGADGSILFSTDSKDKTQRANAVIEGFDTALFTEARQNHRTVMQRSADGNTIVGYAPLALGASSDQLSSQARAGVLFLRYDLQRAHREALRQALSPTFWWGLAIAAVISAILLSLLLNQWLFRPLRRLGAGVEGLAAGVTDVPSGWRGNSEIARLGRSFDHLSRQFDARNRALQHTNENLERQVEKRTRDLEKEHAARRSIEQTLLEREVQLQSVLQTVGEGVALWDDRGLLRYANPAIQDLCWSEGFAVGATSLDDFLARLADEDGQPVFLEPDSDVKRLTVVQAKDENRLCLRLHLARIDGNDGKTCGVVCSVADIAEPNGRAETLFRQAHFDTLTGLPNRHLLCDRMQQALAQHRRSQQQLAVCYLDLDGFKGVNDQFGHQIGDAVLKEAARRLLSEVRANDTVARLGGDEFVVLLCNLGERTEVEPTMHRIIRSLASRYSMGGQEVGEISASVGITIFPTDESEPDTLLRNADHAMYVAKRSGKNTFKWFNPSHEQWLEAQRETLREVRAAVARGEMVLHYQPKVDCRSGTVAGAEALIRWQHPIMGLLPPPHFLSLVKDQDLTLELGDWVIGEALRQRRKWERLGWPLVISVNVFARQLQQTGFVRDLLTRTGPHSAGAPPELELEIVESAALEGVAELAELVRRCRENGIKISLDDFGTGYSTLDHLRKIPVDALKIDRSFIQGILLDAGDRTLVKAIIGLGVAFGREIIAEGVEDLEQVQALLAAGCHLMQGHYFAPAMPADALFAWVRDFKPDAAWWRPLDRPNDQNHATFAGI
jgi:diguanylate cyclase (GGDEF)-like protein